MKRKLVREEIGDQVYEYYPLGKYVVSAPGVCRGRPTFKGKRIEVAGILDRLGAGHPVDEIVAGFKGRFSREALEEAVHLAGKALVLQSEPLAPSAN
jgi:uncharacterized protein (DUF433 family)